MHRHWGAPLPSDHEEGHPMIVHEEIFDFVVVGGGPAGATAANDLANRGRKVALLDRSGRIKPCGGAIPPRLIRDFAIPSHLLKARVRLATMISPKGQAVDMPIDGGGFVGTGCVGHDTSPGASLLGTGRSSMGHMGFPVTRLNAKTNPALVASATMSTGFPFCRTVNSFGAAVGS